MLYFERQSINENCIIRTNPGSNVLTKMSFRAVLNCVQNVTGMRNSRHEPILLIVMVVLAKE